MKKRDVIDLLKAKGFRHLRNGKHEIWSNGQQNIAVPHGQSVNVGLSRWLKVQIKRAEHAEKGRVDDQTARIA